MWLRRVLVVVGLAAIAGLGFVYLGGGIDLLGATTDAESESATTALNETVAPPAPRRAEAVGPSGVSALGRLEPQHGILQVSGPSDLVVVVRTLNVEEGDRVKAGEIIATLDTGDVLAARIGRIEAELVNARRELARSEKLHQEDVLQEAERDRWESEVAILEAEKRQAEAELERSIVYSPIDGQVLEVHTRPGERVGEHGIVELAKTHRMYAIAEVYEADIGRVRRGQRATITSPALPQPLTGTVEWIRLEVAKQDALGTDPAARKDARVVEVRIRLDDSDAAAGLTNLEVEVLIEPSGESD